MANTFGQGIKKMQFIPGTGSFIWYYIMSHWGIVPHYMVTPFKFQLGYRTLSISRELSKDETQMAEKHVLKCPISFAIGEMQIKTILRLHFTPVKLID